LEKVIELTNVSKQFQQKRAVNDISFTIKKGEAVAILGANGAGKTTTILLMLGLLQPSKGTVHLFQSEPKRKEVREKIGSMLQETSVMDSLKVKEIIKLVQSYYPEPFPLTEREQEILALVAAGKTVQEISSTLYLSSGTIRNYISEVLNKLEVKNRIEAISKAQNNGWI